MRTIAPWLALLCVSCRAPYLNRDVHSVAVLMPVDACAEKQAADGMWEPVEQAFRDRGYVVVPRERVAAFYAGKGFSTGEEIRQFTAAELSQSLGCDALVETTVEAYAKTSATITPFDSRVALRTRLVEGKTGDELWQGAGKAGTAGALWRLLTLQTATFAASRRKAVAQCFASLPRPGFAPKR